MHYKESDTNINIENMMPININDYTTYKVNPVMASQSVEYKNELAVCVSLFSTWTFDGGSDAESFCKGTGTEYGHTFQDDLNGGLFNSEKNFKYLSSNNIIIEDGENYIINPIMQEQSIEELNELSICVASYVFYEFDEGTTAETFCKGSGTVSGYTIQEDIDARILDAKNNNYDFLEYGGQGLLDNNIILSKIDLQYFEFTISGKNKYSEKDIWYDVVLNHGDTPENRNTRIKDEFLQFRLVEVNKDKTETLIFTNKNFSSLENKRIHVETIPKNTMNEINKTYRLYMWIDNDVVIGNVDEDYTMDEWNDVFASIKVSVTGNFNEKKLSFSEEFAKIVLAKKDGIIDDDIIHLSGKKDDYDETTTDDIDYNYVWYSGKMWRITAINSDGTMKLVTDENITSISYDYASGLFYVDDTTNSYMYQWLNQEFLPTLYNYENIIVTDNEWNTTATADDTTKPEQITIVTSPVGLLNSYEYYLSYSKTDSPSNGYLNIAASWWLMNLYDTAVSYYVWYVFWYHDYYAYNGRVYDNRVGVRPSICLKSNVELSGGDGSYKNPYTIKGDKEEISANLTLLNTRSSGEYVSFDNELYRIVNIENDGTIKINKTKSLVDENNEEIEKMLTSSLIYYGSSSSEDYWDYYLNNIWYDNISDDYKNMLVEGTYYLDTDNDIGYKGTICSVVNSTISTKDCEKITNTWTGYVGVPRYGEIFAAHDNTNVWLITPYFDKKSTYVMRSGSVYSGANGYPCGVRPSLTLSSNVKITSGTGTEYNPFQVTIN